MISSLRTKLKHGWKVLSLMAALLFLFLMNIANAETTTSKRLIVYFPNWGTYNAAHKNMTVGMIPWSKVTVINHAFFEVDSSYKLASTDTFADYDKWFDHSEGWDTGDLRGHFGEYKYYKSQYPSVKVLISVGGWTRGQNFHAMALTAANRAIFIQSVVNFLKQYPFLDGVDLDWEYPGVNRAADPNDQYDKGCPGGPEDKANYTALLRELRTGLNNNGLSSKLITVAAPAGYDKLELQEPDIYAQYVDWFNVMTYDFHGAWETTTNHATPLYVNPNDPSATSPVDIKNKYNVDYAMRNLRDNYHISAGKLNVGTPFYSRGWKNVTGGTNGMFANASGAPVGSWDNAASPGGQYPYFELKTMENASGYVKYRDQYAMTPWLYNSSTGVTLSYEDETSLSTKCDYINSNNFGGLIVWEISGDDASFTLTNLAYNKLITGGGTVTVATPSFNLSSGTYTNAQSITISCATTGAVIRYTKDGTSPTSSSSVYSGPITVSTTTTIKAKAFAAGMNDSVEASATYTISTSSTTSYKVIGYVYGTPSNINAQKLTHVNYAFASIVNGQVSVATPSDLSTLTALKSANSNLKIILSIGGWGADGFSDAALTESSRATFAASCQQWITNYNLDGIDIDWEYPVNGGWGEISCRPEDKVNFTLLLQAVRNKIGTGKILSIAGGAGSEFISNTELSSVASICDYINIMTYDFGAYAHNANLYSSSSYSSGISCDTAIKNYIAAGVPAAKINMGVPFYGRYGGNWPTFAELTANYINLNGWVRYWDDQAKACYLLKNGEFITYDDVETFGYKTSYIKSNSLGGVMFWQYNQDYQETLLSKLWSDLKGDSNPGGSAPGLASLSVDNTTNAGTYTVTITVPAGNTATSMTLYENSTAVKTQSVTASSTTDQVITYAVSSKSDGTYSYYVSLTNAYGTTSTSSITVTVKTGSGPSDGTDSGTPSGVPGTPSLTADNWDGDGNYVITFNMWWGNNGTSWKIYENDQLIYSAALQGNSPNSQTASYNVTGKANGSYKYRIDLINKYGTTSSGTVTANVTNSSGGGNTGTAPGAASLSVNSATNTGNYTVTVSVPANNTATSMTLYENSAAVKTQVLTANASSAQTITYTVNGETAGTYTYYAALSNAYGTTSSSNLTVTVSSNGGGTAAEWQANTAYKVGDLVTYQGLTYKCIQAHTSLVGWEPPVVPALWQLQ